MGVYRTRESHAKAPPSPTSTTTSPLAAAEEWRRPSCRDTKPACGPTPFTPITYQSRSRRDAARRVGPAASSHCTQPPKKAILMFYALFASTAMLQPQLRRCRTAEVQMTAEEQQFSRADLKISSDKVTARQVANVLGRWKNGREWNDAGIGRKGLLDDVSYARTKLSRPEHASHQKKASSSGTLAAEMRARRRSTPPKELAAPMQLPRYPLNSHSSDRATSTRRTSRCCRPISAHPRTSTLRGVRRCAF